MDGSRGVLFQSNETMGSWQHMKRNLPETIGIIGFSPVFWFFDLFPKGVQGPVGRGICLSNAERGSWESPWDEDVSGR